VGLLHEDLRELREERQLLERIAALAARCDGRVPAGVLDAVLSATGWAAPILPAQRRGGTT
jgi:hypothetical protein